MKIRDRLIARPVVRKLSQKYFSQHAKYFYPRLTRRIIRGPGADELLFINFGYEEDPPMELPLAASDEPNQFWIHLYHRTATQVELRGKRVLEVSCGHGGGASYLVRTLQPASYTGLDLNPAGIAFCRKRHNLPGLDFVRGNAEELPFPDQSFDAVINIEASILYPRLPRFLTEVARVLRPGGHFLYADSRPQVLIPEWEAALSDAPMRMLSQRVINAEVLRGIEKNWQRWQDLTNSPGNVSPARGVLSVDGPVAAGLQNGDVSYRIYCFAEGTPPITNKTIVLPTTNKQTRPLTSGPAG